MKIRVLLLLSIIFLSAAPITQFFYTQEVIAVIEDDRLIEASGIEESYENPGYFWTHNDSGSGPTLYLIDNNAQIVMELELGGIINRDWEEIVTAKIGGKSYIYVAEIGDNKAVHESVRILEIPEPRLEGKSKITIDKREIDVMSFTYAEGARDAEAVLYDHNQNEFVLVTKREKNALVYSFPFVPNEQPAVIKSKGTIPAKLFTAADMNEQGEILLKHYGAIYYWGESEKPAVDRILAWDAVMVDYIPEPQGEAICWHKGDFYTISEKNIGKPQEMLYFKRMP